ncbi:PqqD family protein [Melioribacteraceae bacterium 4301-Me]|uniref:PqqD family protein n=1 Tax=Pyranulibacter aquaticus TaxID=3163344 RepID=UPI00359A22F2
MLSEFLERRKILKGKNALELTPIRLCSFESDAQSQVTILIPKFKRKLAVKYLLPLLKSPNIKLNLDEYGSFVWLNMDGLTTVGSIAKKMKEKFGDGFYQAEYRISKYITQLYEQRLITFKEIQKKENQDG